MIDSILFDFFGTLVRYSASRTIQEYTQTHDYVRTNIIPLKYESFLETWDKSFCHLEQQSRETHVEFSMKDVVSEFLDSIGEKQLSDDAKAEFIELFMSEWSAEIQPVPEVDRLLDQLSSKYKLGIVSNTHLRPAGYGGTLQPAVSAPFGAALSILTPRAMYIKCMYD